ncbi:MAG: dienelactone hydrolase family protein, partial [Thiohalomonadales bacterium]|nr:dienelactone hydrolase family protein [Thiohalomonadales bacterium]
ATTKIRFVFPHAPSRPITINNGMVMPAWYDIASPQLDQIEDEAGIRRSQQYLEQLIQRETERGIKSEKIILAGFSQGGAIALYTGLRYSQPLAGIIALSTYLPLAQTTSREASEANRQIPILLAHGSHDPIIPLRLAEGSRHYLEQLGYKPEWKIYFMEHSVCPDEIRDISRWLIQLIAG